MGTEKREQTEAKQDEGKHPRRGRTHSVFALLQSPKLRKEAGGKEKGGERRERRNEEEEGAGRRKEERVKRKESGGRMKGG